MIRTYKSAQDALAQSPDNKVIQDSIARAWYIINNPDIDRIMVSVSGGRDSDIILDMCYRMDVDKKINYVFFDTGIEYGATKDHLDSIEKKYGIRIERERCYVPVVTAVKDMVSHLYQKT